MQDIQPKSLSKKFLPNVQLAMVQDFLKCYFTFYFPNFGRFDLMVFQQRKML